MQTYELEIADRVITLASDDETLVRTSSGRDRLLVRFLDDEWLGFDHVAVAMSNGEAFEESEVSLVGGTEPYAYAEVPDEVLLAVGDLGVCVHAWDSEGRHIITRQSHPLTVEPEGDAVGEYEPPSASIVDGYLVTDGTISDGYLTVDATVSGDYMVF